MTDSLKAVLAALPDSGATELRRDNIEGFEPNDVLRACGGEMERIKEVLLLTPIRGHRLVW